MTRIRPFRKCGIAHLVHGYSPVYSGIRPTPFEGVGDWVVTPDCNRSKYNVAHLPTGRFGALWLTLGEARSLAATFEMRLKKMSHPDEARGLSEFVRQCRQECGVA